MKLTTPLTDLLGIELPIVQAPMAGSTPPELVAACCNAGALGSFGAAATGPVALRDAIRRIRALTSRPFSVNLFAHRRLRDVDPHTLGVANAALAPYRAELGLREAPPPDRFDEDLDEQLAVIAEEKVPVFSFHLGIPSPASLDRARAAGCKLIGSATTVREAKALEDAGVDAIVAQGLEAGGHRGTFLAPLERSLVGTFALVPQVVDAVKVPVIAAGAVADGRGLLAALALGAAGVQPGTAFLQAPEAGASSAWKTALAAASDESTCLTRAFSGRPARAVRNRFLEEMEGRPIAPFPAQNALTRPLRGAATQQERGEFLSLWGGQAAALAKPAPAAEIIRRMVAEAEEVLRRLG